MCFWLIQYVHSALRFIFDEDGLMLKKVLFRIVVVILLWQLIIPLQMVGGWGGR